MSQSDISSAILAAIRDSQSIGISPRQVAIKTGLEKPIVVAEIERLAKENVVILTGCRGSLYIMPKFKETLTSNLLTSQWYKSEFEKSVQIQITENPRGIRFTENILNGGKRIHRWSPYVQGFSNSFVEDMLTRHKIALGMKVGDLLVGSGTVSVCCKMQGIDSLGIDCNPLMVFMSKVKTNWTLDTSTVQKVADKIIDNAISIQGEKTEIPFLKKTRLQFQPKILRGLSALKREIERTSADEGIRNFIRLAFASILVDCSNLWRAPSLGYAAEKRIPKGAPFDTFRLKLACMLEDLRYVQGFRDKWGETEILEADSRTYPLHPESLDIIITSPPYVNGIDYVLNYKVELAWLGFAKSYDDLQTMRSSMIVCDNTSRGDIREFEEKIGMVKVDEWLDDIVAEMGTTLKKKGICRRIDMHTVVERYFVDLLAVMRQAFIGLKRNGRFVFVVGDSLISGSYIPADLILARLGKKIGFKVESIEVARERRSGQKRNFVLRESIVTLSKGDKKEPNEIPLLDLFA